MSKKKISVFSVLFSGSRSIRLRPVCSGLLSLYRNSALSRPARIYLCFVTAAYITAGAVCAGLLLGAFGFTDPVNARILAGQMTHSLIRTAVPAVFMTLLIEMRLKKS